MEVPGFSAGEGLGQSGRPRHRALEDRRAGAADPHDRARAERHRPPHVEDPVGVRRRQQRAHAGGQARSEELAERRVDGPVAVERHLDPRVSQDRPGGAASERDPQGAEHARAGNVEHVAPGRVVRRWFGERTPARSQRGQHVPRRLLRVEGRDPLGAPECPVVDVGVVGASRGGDPHAFAEGHRDLDPDGAGGLARARHRGEGEGRAEATGHHVDERCVEHGAAVQLDADRARSPDVARAGARGPDRVDLAGPDVLGDHAAARRRAQAGGAAAVGIRASAVVRRRESSVLAGPHHGEEVHPAVGVPTGG